MLKYFRKRKSRHGSVVSESADTMDNVCIESICTDSTTEHFMCSTSTFCDEMVLDEFLKTTTSDNVEDDVISCGAMSLGTLSNPGVFPNTYSVMEADKELFEYHSRLSMTLSCIVNEPNCLSYFVQYLEGRNALSLIKLYLDTQNFKNAALAEMRREQKNATLISKDNSNYTHDKNKDDKYEECSNGVPELKTLCDLSMRKPITDDEKSQIYAETSKQLYKHNERPKRQLSIWSLSGHVDSVSDGACLNEFRDHDHDHTQICENSVQDALAIYQKYLICNAPLYVQVPVDIISKISLILCKKPDMNDSNVTQCCTITADCFVEAQQYALNKLEKEYLNDFLQSNYYSKYCMELVESEDITIYDILHSEVTLFYFMEYLEQQGERHCLDFWSAAINYRKGYISMGNQYGNEEEARSDAMIIYEKFFSLQLEGALWANHKLRAYVESTICSEKWVSYCFDLPLKVAAIYMERKFLKNFLKSTLFANYLNELKERLKTGMDEVSPVTRKFVQKAPLRRCVSDKANRHRKTLSDCTFDKKCLISQQNTLLASIDRPSTATTTATAHLKQFKLDIDSNQLTNPDLLWHRSHGTGLRFGRVNSFGRYERDFILPSDALTHSSPKSGHNWSLPLNGHKLKNAMRKLVHLPADDVQEEIAWQVAEMIVKDITNVTMNDSNAAAETTTTTKTNFNSIKPHTTDL